MHKLQVVGIGKDNKSIYIARVPDGVWLMICRIIYSVYTISVYAVAHFKTNAILKHELIKALCLYF